MTLPSSGPLALTDIQTEFGGSNPIGMNEYYAGGGLVPAGTTGTYGAVPSSGALSVQNFYGTSNYIPVYVEDLFSTYLYTGNTTARSITNDIDLSTKGGMVWIKSRNYTQSYALFDTARGALNLLSSNTTNASTSVANTLTSFNTNGFSLGTDYLYVNDIFNYVSWTFRKQPKFFDVVTYTGNGVVGRTISHSLGSTPGCIMIKRTSGGSDWVVYHQSVGSSATLILNGTFAAANYGNNISNVTSTSFDVTGGTDSNANGSTYVAYIFAHNAGGFGLTGTDNVISCGSFTTDGSGNATVNLGYEPQWLLAKRTSGTSDWEMLDNMRSWSQTNFRDLYANSSSAEGNTNGSYCTITSTGFTTPTAGFFYPSSTYIYIAIRKGPMKVPTDATKVFAPTLSASSSPTTFVSTGFPVDLTIGRERLPADNTSVFDRLRGAALTTQPRYLFTNTTDAEGTASTGYGVGMTTSNTGFINNWWSGSVQWNFRRAPGFFDEVCASGPSTTNHNLGVLPELVFFKTRNVAAPWDTVCSGLTGGINGNYYLDLNSTNSQISNSVPILPVTSTTINPSVLVSSGTTWVAYLFATCPGVSKVAAVTKSTGLPLTINAGFTSSARFVIMKRVDAAGDWYVWDSARGINFSGNDPYLLLNSTNPEVTSTDYIRPLSFGFEMTSTFPGGRYIYLAIA